MSTSNLLSPKRDKKSGRSTVAVFSVALTLVAGALVLWRFHDLGFIRYATAAMVWLQSNLSVLKVTLIVGFGGSLLSIPLVRKRGRGQNVSQSASQPSIVSQPIKVHPLMLTPRPSRDSQFVIRKTKKRGRIARNRDGERLPSQIPE